MDIPRSRSDLSLSRTLGRLSSSSNRRDSALELIRYNGLTSVANRLEDDTRLTSNEQSTTGTTLKRLITDLRADIRRQLVDRELIAVGGKEVEYELNFHDIAFPFFTIAIVTRN